MSMIAAPTDINKACRELLDRFFAAHPGPALQKSALKTLRILAAGDEPMTGKPEGWAAGIIYAMANRDRQACGVPGMLNIDLAQHFGVSLSTVRERASRVGRALEI